MKHTISTVVIALCVCVIAHAAGTPPAGVYIGTTDNFRFRSFALVIRDDGTGVFIPGPGNQGEPPYGGRRQWLEVFAPSSDTFELGAPGTDFWHQISITPSGALSGIMRFPRAPSIPDIRIQAERSVSTIAAAKYAGYYRGDGVSFIIAPSGQLFVICATDARNDVGLSGAGYVGPGGQISASGGFRLSFSGQIEDGILTGTVYSAGFFSSDFSCINPAFAARAIFANPSALLSLVGRGQPAGRWWSRSDSRSRKGGSRKGSTRWSLVVPFRFAKSSVPLPRFWVERGLVIGKVRRLRRGHGTTNSDSVSWIAKTLRMGAASSVGAALSRRLQQPAG